MLLKCSYFISSSVKVDPESFKGPGFCSHPFKRTQCASGKGCWIGYFVVNERQVKGLSQSVFTVSKNYAMGTGERLGLYSLSSCLEDLEKKAFC